MSRVSATGEVIWTYTDTDDNNTFPWALEAFGLTSYVSLPAAPGAGEAAVLKSFDSLGNELFGTQVFADVRVGLGANSGDSGAGYVSPTLSGPPSRAAIDGIHACSSNSGGFSFGNTAYDVKQQLGGADFNCSMSVQINAAASSWGSCPGINR